MKIIAQSETPKWPFYLHLGYTSASQREGGIEEGAAAFIITVIFFMLVRAFVKNYENVPQFEIQLNYTGNQLFNERKYDEALECFNKAIRENPHYDQSYYNKGHALMKLNKKAEALESFRQYLERTKNDNSAKAVAEIIDTLSREEVG